MLKENYTANRADHFILYLDNFLIESSLNFSNWIISIKLLPSRDKIELKRFHMISDKWKSEFKIKYHMKSLHL